MWQNLFHKELDRNSEDEKNDSEQFFTPGSYLCFALWVLKRLSSGKPLQSGEYRTSTIYSALKRLQKDNYVIYSDRYEMEDPFFREWILASDKAPFA